LIVFVCEMISVCRFCFIFGFFGILMEGLKISISPEIVVKTPISTRTIEAGLLHLLEEAHYPQLARIIQFSSLNTKWTYAKALLDDKTEYYHQFILHVLHLFMEGFIVLEDVKSLLPSKVISSMITKLSSDKIAALPENPLTKISFPLSKLSETELITVLDRSKTELDPLIVWSRWPSQVSPEFLSLWEQDDLWKILLLRSFCEAPIAIKHKFIHSLRLGLKEIHLQEHSLLACLQMLLLNVSLFAFYLQIHQDLKENSSLKGQIEELEEASADLFEIIKKSPLKKQLKLRDWDLFVALDLNSARLVGSVHGSRLPTEDPFYYEPRIKSFHKIIQKLDQVPVLFSDWFGNLISIYVSVFSKMPWEVLSDFWTLLLKHNPSVEIISGLLSLFRGLIKEDFRLKLAQQLSPDLLYLYYRNSSSKSIPKVSMLIPFTVRKSDYLKYYRAGSHDDFGYEIDKFWNESTPPIIKLLKLFDLVQSKEMDLFETIDTTFVIDRRQQISFKRFLESVLSTFLEVKEWYILMNSGDGSEKLSIIPSLLFPPKFAPVLVKFIVRCMHLSCEAPFTIFESYLILAFRAWENIYDHVNDLKNLAKTQLDYLNISNRLPKLSMTYKIYFDRIKAIHAANIDQFQFLRMYFGLHKVIKVLWTSSNNPIHLTEEQLEELQEEILENMASTLHLFGNELFIYLGGRLFGEIELKQLLFT
jgi:hypothetical protein